MKYFGRKTFWSIKNASITVKSFVNPLYDVDLNFSGSSFDSYSTSTYFVLSEVTVLCNSSSLSLKSAFLQNSQYQKCLLYLMMLILHKKFLMLTLFVPVPRWVAHNTDLPSDSNISKTIRLNFVFLEQFLKNIQQNFLWHAGW